MDWVHPLGILIIGIGTELFYLFCLAIHYTWYSFDGEGLFAFYVISTLSKTVSHTLVMWLLLMIGYGWTISYEELEDKDIYIILMCFVIMVNMMISGLTFIDHGDAYKYHDYGGPQGFVLMSLRVLIWAAFMYGALQTKKSCPKKSQPFLKSFIVSSTLYFLGFPVLWLFSSFTSPYIRNRMITFGNFTFQILAISVLVYQFSRRDSKYNKAS